jgi:hypothetical protein
MPLNRFVALLALCMTPALAAAQRPIDAAQQDSVREWVEALRPELGDQRIDISRAVAGPRVVGAGERVAGDVLTYRGDLEVLGEVDGNAISIGGDLIVQTGATIRGDAIALGGTVRHEGGLVMGESRSVAGHAPGIEPLFAERPAAVRGPREVLSFVAAWFAVMAAISFAVLLLARSNLVTAADRIRNDFGKALLVGLIGQLALAPALVLLVAGLALTIIGILLIPFALVAYLLAVIGMAMLGFLAMASANGRSLRRGDGDESVGDVTRHLMIGLAAYFALWAVAALVGPLGLVGSLIRAMVVVITWVALTVGFGAVLLSRGGTRSPAAPAVPEPEEDSYTWQTPTPVSGVAAARRPTPAPRPAEWK